jgi:hypothetical protein
MARGAEAKLRRRNRRKNGGDASIDMFGDETTGGEEFPPMPLGRPKKTDKKKKKVDDDDDDDDDEDDDEYDFDAQGGQDEIPLPMPKKKSKKPATAGTQREGGAGAGTGGNKGGGGGGIKTTPLILLFLMVGTAVLPVLIYAGDYFSSFLAKTDFTGNIGYGLGIGSVPRKRTVAFYEKHAPEKLNDVPTILSKHYGDYPKLIKKLERKYHDYGYFVGWEEDEAIFTHVKEQAKEWYDIWLQQYWNRYAPQQLKTAFRNIRYNLTYLYKKGRRLYRKHVWPVLEPIFGVPKGGEAQKRKDAAEARKRREQQQRGAGGMASSAGGRKKHKDYRDDVED